MLTCCRLLQAILNHHQRLRLLSLCSNGTEYQYYTDSEVSTFKCTPCVKILCLQQSNDTPVKTHSSTSDLPKKVISPEWSLVLPSVIASDKYEALCVQLESVRFNGICTTDLIKYLINAVSKLSEDVTQP